MTGLIIIICMVAMFLYALLWIISVDLELINDSIEKLIDAIYRIGYEDIIEDAK